MVPGLAVAVLTMGVGDDAIDVARALRHADEAADVARHSDDIANAARQADELVDVANVATRHSDELVNVAETGARRGDDFASAKQITPRPTNKPDDFKEAARWFQEKSEAGEVDDILDWMREYQPSAKIDEIEDLLRKDLADLKVAQVRSPEGPPSPKLLEAIVESMNSHPLTKGGKFLPRSIPVGAEKYYGYLPSKPVGTKTLLEGPNGLRLLKNTGTGEIYFGVSDLEAAAVITKDGRPITNDQFVKIFVDGDNNINKLLSDKLGREVAVAGHGDHLNGMGQPIFSEGASLDAKGAEMVEIIDAETGGCASCLLTRRAFRQFCP